MVSNRGPQPRAAHLLDDITSRDLYGTVRGACSGCSDCGRYIIKTKEKYTSKHQSIERHPDNDPSITFCSRCGCSPDAHEIVIWENERELGSDAYALNHFDSALVHYTRAIDLHPVDATLWTNRAAAYLCNGWHAQALHDGQHAVSLKPDWFRPWQRKGAALLGLGKAQEALEAYLTALKCAQDDVGVNEDTISGIKKAIQEAEKKIFSENKKKNTDVASTSSLKHNLKKVARPADPVVPSRRATVNPRTPAHTEEIKTEISSSYSFSPEAKNFYDGDAAQLTNVDNVPSFSMLAQQQLFAEVQAQYNEVVKQVETLKTLMDRLQEQMNFDENSTSAIASAARQQEQQQHSESVGSESLAHTLDRDRDYSGITTGRDSDDGSVSTEDGAVQDIEEDLNSNSEDGGKGKEEGRDVGSDLPSSPILRRKTTETTFECDISSHIDSDKEEEEGELQQQQQQETIVLPVGDAKEESSSDNELDAEFEWLDTIQAARNKLYGTTETSEYGFVPPPPASSSDFLLSSPRRRKAKNATFNTETPGQGSTSIKDSVNDNSTSSTGTSSKLDLGSLQSLFVAAAAQQRKKDPLGIERYACKICGVKTCPQYTNIPMGSSIQHAAISLHQQEPPNSQQQHSAAMLQARQCASCRCDCTAHETKEEAKVREDAEQRAKERQERILRQREERLQRQQQQQQRQPPPSPETERIKRVVSAAARKAAAEEAGTCGCTADSHPIDSSWEQKETARREAENAAAARAAARARHSFHSQAAAADARKEEAAAYAALGLHYGADAKAVTRAYKRLALKLHPDKVNVARRSSGEGDEKDAEQDAEAEAEAHAAFVKVTQAYKFLSELKQ